MWYDYIQWYATSQERIAKAVKEAAEAAKATAREIGKTTETEQQEAGLAAVQVVKERADMAQKDALALGRDGFAAAVTAAEKASATEIAIAQAIKEAALAGRRRAFEAGKTSEAEQKAAGLAAVKSIKEAIDGIRENALNNTMKSAGDMARNAARDYAIFKGITPDNAANVINNAINNKITQIENNIVIDGDIGDIRREAAIVVAMVQIALVEEAKLNAAKSAEDLALTRGSVRQPATNIEQQSRLDANNAINRLENAMNAKGNDDLVRTIAALEFAARLQARAKAAKAAKELARLTGEDNPGQKRAATSPN